MSNLTAEDQFDLDDCLNAMKIAAAKGPDVVWHCTSWAAGRLADEVERLRAQVETATAGYKAAVQKSEWQARTNGEMNKLAEENYALRTKLGERYA